MIEIGNEDRIEIIASEAVDAGQCVVVDGNVPVYVGSLYHMPVIEAGLVLFVSPEDMKKIRRAIRMRSGEPTA